MQASRTSRRHVASNRGEKYKRILDAALHVFARDGYHEAKIAEIARVANVASGTIYLYFKNKDDLLISVFEAKLEEIVIGVRNRLADATGAWEKIQSFVRFHLSLATDPDLNAFVTVELRRSAKFIKGYPKHRFGVYLDELGNAINQAKAEGLYPSEMRTGILKHLIFGALDHACMVWIINPRRTPEDLVAVGNQLLAMIHPTARGLIDGAVLPREPLAPPSLAATARRTE